MDITAEDAKTLSAMLGNLLQTGWNLRVTVPNGSYSIEHEVRFLRMDGHGLRVEVADQPLAVATGAFTIPLEKVEALHIY